MSATDIAFVGSIPALYDRYLGPLLFEPYAGIVAERAKALRPRRILETAAGTGIVTAALHAALPDAEIVATDLNQAMLDVAAEHIRSDKVSFQAADAQLLPFADSAFDLVVCQFGIMFYPDRVGANREARRVLCDGGRYLLAVWEPIERSPLVATVRDVLGELYPDNPAAFLERGPHGYGDPAQIEHDLLAAGFTDIELETVELRSTADSARLTAFALCQGSPLRLEIEQRGVPSLEEATDAVAKALERFEGPDGVDAPMSAHILTAIK
jgi:ubiquinone/menaquinone biosynthesis C-methylase UbiE